MSILTEIRNDVFDIAERLKEIDPSYRVFYSGNKGRFELHGGREQGLIMTLPFDRLDVRTVEHVRRTRIERLRQELAEMEEQNRRAEESAMREAKAAANDMLRESADRVYYDGKRRKD